jgi:hypothetical protein
MPLTSKGEKILGSMQEQYGAEKGKQVFYASKNAGKLTGVDSAETRDANPMLQAPVPERQDLIGKIPTESGGGGYRPDNNSNTSLQPTIAPQTGKTGNTIVGSDEMPKDRSIRPAIGDAKAGDEGEAIPTAPPVSTTAAAPTPMPSASIPPAPTADRRLKIGDSNPVGDQSMRNWNARNKAFYGV